MRALLLVVLIAAVLGACSRPKPEPTASEDKRESGLVEMSLEAQKHVGLQVESAEVRKLNEYLQVPGTVQATDSRVNTVRSLARGRLHDVLVQVGDRVRTGQVLATYDNIEAGELLAQVAAARADLQKLRVRERNLARQADRALALAGIGAVARKEYEQARAEQQGAEEEIKSQESVISGIAGRLRRFDVSDTPAEHAPLTTISSPLSGVITKLKASPGEVIDPESELFTVADLSIVWVQAEVYEKDLGRIQVAQPAFITVDTYADEQFAGKVTYISDFLDPQTRTAKVRCEVPNPAVRLKLDMFANVNLPTTFSRQVLTVPAGAIQTVGDRTVVFIQKAPTKFEPRWVTAGKTVRGFVEITHGLNPGEPAVKAGSFHLKSILTGKDLGEE